LGNWSEDDLAADSSASAVLQPPPATAAMARQAVRSAVVTSVILAPLAVANSDSARLKSFAR